MSLLKRIWECWKVIAHAIGNFQARLLLALFYFLLLAPFGLGVRLLSDPLGLRKKGHAYWSPTRRQTTNPWDRAKQLF